VAIAALGLAAVLALAAPAGAVRVTCGNGSGQAGQTVDIAVTTTDLTGWNVRAFQFDLTYNQNLVTVTDVLEAGTLPDAAGWGDATFGVLPGRVSVSHAGTSALSGAGTLLVLRFVVNPAQLTPTSTALTFGSLTFNEGVPNDTTANGTLTIQATPVITVSPNTGELVRAQTLQFTVSGSVTNPVTWQTTNPAVATISGTGLLTGQAPGHVRVFAVDAAARRDTTDADVFVRGMGLTVVTGTTVVGQPLTLPITVTSLGGLGIRAGQLTLSFNGAALAATSVSTPPGTLLYGWGPVGFGAANGTCTVDFAGSTDLAGAGVLCNVTFQTLLSGGHSISAPTALFNETLPAKVTNGTASVSALPTITVIPETAVLLAGQTRQFTLSGTVTPPVTWSTLDPAVATISPSGLLTAVGGGATRVRAVDDVGATDENTSVTVYDFALSLPTVQAPPGATVILYLAADRPLDALDVRSLQYRLTFHPTWITAAEALPSGLVGAWGPGGTVDRYAPGTLDVAAAGTDPMGPGSTVLQPVRFTVSPLVPVGTNLPITLGSVLCNEGHPTPQVASGQILVRTTADAPDPLPLAFGMGPVVPNPSAGAVRFRLAVPGGGADARVRVVLYGVDGRLVRTLASGALTPGEHDLRWDGRDESGRPAPAGLYLVRAQWNGQTIARKFARIR
jgi:hypothetical protein